METTTNNTIKMKVSTYKEKEVEILLPHYRKWGPHFVKVYGAGDRDCIHVTDMSDLIGSGVSSGFVSHCFNDGYEECSEAEFVAAYNKITRLIASKI